MAWLHEDPLTLRVRLTDKANPVMPSLTPVRAQTSRSARSTT